MNEWNVMLNVKCWISNKNAQLPTTFYGKIHLQFFEEEKMKYDIFTKFGHGKWPTCRFWLWRQPHFCRSLEKCLDVYWLVSNPQYEIRALHLYGSFDLSACRLRVRYYRVLKVRMYSSTSRFIRIIGFTLKERKFLLGRILLRNMYIHLSMDMTLRPRRLESLYATERTLNFAGQGNYFCAFLL
jgi:hypothetical protein